VIIVIVVIVVIMVSHVPISSFPRSLIIRPLYGKVHNKYMCFSYPRGKENVFATS